MMLQWEQGHPDSDRVQELLLMLDSINFVDMSSVAQGREYKTGMAQQVSKSCTSGGNYVKRDKEESTIFFMVHETDQPEVGDSVFQIPDDMCASEAYNQYTGDDDEPAEDHGSEW